MLISFAQILIVNDHHCHNESSKGTPIAVPASFAKATLLCPICLVIYDDKVNSVREAHLNDVHILRRSKSISFLQYFVNICTFLSTSYL